MINISDVRLDQTQESKAIIQTLVERIEDAGMRAVDVNDTKPWGGYVRLDDSHAAEFINQFFASAPVPTEAIEGQSVSPKFLLVAPHQRLSWQRHQRRSEVWHFLTPGGAYSVSDDPEVQPVTEASDGAFAVIGRGQCHRLLSKSEEFVLVAEIWQHAEPDHLSDEDDIERLEDDYQR